MLAVEVNWEHFVSIVKKHVSMLLRGDFSSFKSCEAVVFHGLLRTR